MRISVIIPSFNRAGLVTRTLDSVFGQTRLPDEVIVVDDGSADDTRAVVARYAGPVAYHHQENRGLTGARQAGLGLSSGDHVCFLDSDDLLRPEALARLEAALADAPAAALAYCRSQTIDEHDRVTEPLWDKPDFAGDVWPELIRTNFIRSPGAVLVRRAHLDRIGDADIPPAVADWGMWLRLAERAPFVRVPEPLFQYRVHSSSMSGNVIVMYRATYRLYRFFLRRHRGDRVRRQAVIAAFQFTQDYCFGSLFERARQHRAQGDFRSALRDLNMAVRLSPRHLEDWNVARFYLGTCRRMVSPAGVELR